MTQVGLSGRVNEGRQPGALNWGPYHEEDFRPVNRDPVSVTFPYYIHFLSFFFARPAFLFSLESCSPADFFLSTPSLLSHYVHCPGSQLFRLPPGLCVPDPQERNERAVRPPCPPGLNGPGFLSVCSSRGVHSSQPFLRLTHQSHPRGVDAPFPEPSSPRRLPQLRPASS